MSDLLHSPPTWFVFAVSVIVGFVITSIPFWIRNAQGRRRDREQLARLERQLDRRQEDR